LQIWDGDGSWDGSVHDSGGVGDSGGVVGVDLGQGAELEAVDVGENGGAARGDAVLCKELVEVHEGIVDALRRLEVLGLASEVGKVIGGFDLVLFGTVLRTESGVRVEGKLTALAAIGCAISATKG
jgi:hypothetical protein